MFLVVSAEKWLIAIAIRITGSRVLLMFLILCCFVSVYAGLRILDKPKDDHYQDMEPEKPNDNMITVDSIWYRFIAMRG